MFVSSLRLVNFRSYCDAAVHFGPGLNVVVGENAAGKTNLLEAAWFALRGSSPRTRRDEKLITWGERFARVELRLEAPNLGAQQVDVGFAPGQAKRIRWQGLDVPTLDDLRSRSQVFIFVPESLLLVKGSPARRRAHLDAFAAALDSHYAAAVRDLQAVLRQRNAQLVAVKHGAHPAALDPWESQFARVAVELGRRRRDLVGELAAGFGEAAAALAPAGERFTLKLVAQLDGVGYDEAALLDELRARRPGEERRGLSLYGPHRDDLKFLEVGPEPPKPTPVRADTRGAADDEMGAASASAAVKGRRVCGPVELPRGGRDLRLFGSQGEQRAAVLALLLAEQRLAAAHAGRQGPLFLNDVIVELDDPRRRLLVRMLGRRGRRSSRPPTGSTSPTRSWRARRSSSFRWTARSPPARPAPPLHDDAPPAPPELDAL